MAEERDRFGGRMRRYGRVSRAAGTLAARLVHDRVTTPRAAASLPSGTGPPAALVEALGKLKGPLMKVAQILATIPDALPPEYVERLASLQSHAPSMGPAFAARRMEAELGADWRKRFASFDMQAAHAASLGQVHRAFSLDGTEKLACKLQYPDMESTVSADLRQLQVILGLYHRYDRSVDTSLIYEELAERLHEELDYEREARHIALYRLMLAGEEGVCTPVPQLDLSTKRLLTMEWLDGRSLLDLRKESKTLRERVARNLFHAWYAPFYRYGVIHGDPHAGNYSASGEGRVNLLDFGCIRVFPARFVGAVIGLGKALIQGDEEGEVASYAAWGFDISSREMLDTLNLWARFVYAPLMEDRKRAMIEVNSTQEGARVLFKVREQLRQLGGVRPPREFVLMDRAAIGLGSAMIHLGAELNWRHMYQELIEGFDEAGLARRQGEALVSVGLEPVAA